MSKPIKTMQDAINRYGPIINGVWKGESTWMDLYIPPQWFQDQVLGLDGKHCKKIYMNKDMYGVMDQALKNVFDRGLAHELISFDGCFNIRMVRGSKTEQSTHSYALAVDLNAPENPLGGPIRFSKEFIQAFKDAGFSAGAEFHRIDGQHFSYAWE